MFEVTHKNPKVYPSVKEDALSMSLKESRFQLSTVINSLSSSTGLCHCLGEWFLGFTYLLQGAEGGYLRAINE